MKRQRISFKKFKKVIHRESRLFCAVIVAAWFSATHPLSSFWRVLGALRLWIAFWRKPGRAPFWLTYRRYRACRRCVIFHSKFNTCGSPLDKELTGLGCHCQMEHKASILDAQCFLDERSADSFTDGWRGTEQRYAAAKLAAENTSRLVAAAKQHRAEHPTAGATIIRKPCRCGSRLSGIQA